MNDLPIRQGVQGVKALLDAKYTIDNHPGPRDERDLVIRAKCRALMEGYSYMWIGAGLTPVAVEQVYTADLVNPATGRKSKTFRTSGKIDCYVQDSEGRRYILDHKTCSEDIEAADAAYWRHLKLEGQVTQYMMLMWASGERPEGAIWDVIRKPSISPRSLTKALAKQALETGCYFAQPLSLAELEGIGSGELQETPEMYEARLVYDCVVERPGRYFARRFVPRMDQDILRYCEDLWQHGQDILASRKIERLPPNSGACMLYGSPCQFLGLCSGYDTTSSDRWRQKESRHPELGVHGNMDALTNSRVRCFQTCKVKHRYEHELMLERNDYDRETLYFGTVLHEGLRSWWEAFLPNETESQFSIARSIK